MRTVAAVVGCLALSIGYTIFPLAVWRQLQYRSVASAQVSPKESDELHFVSVLTLHGEVVAIDPANRLVTVRDAKRPLFEIGSSERKGSRFAQGGRSCSSSLC